MKMIKVSDKAHEYLMKKAVDISVAQVVNNELFKEARRYLTELPPTETVLDQIYVRFDALENAFQDMIKPREDVRQIRTQTDYDQFKEERW